MDAIVERCCGLDVHQASVVACLLVGSPEQKPRKQTKNFGTTTGELEALKDWLSSAGCTHVGMESTGVYWMPVYSVLEGHFVLVVGNAQHMKNVPGRKTDVKDSEWIADLLRHGLIRPSFVPPKPIRELRELLRYRTKLVQSRSSERNRLIKLLESANIKLASVASNVFGVSGMAMVRALARGDATPAEMALLARGALRKKLDSLVLALHGRLEEQHRFLLGVQIARLDRLEADVTQLDQRIRLKLEPYREAQERLEDIPGVDWVTAAVIIAELGVDMSVFPTAGHVSSWAGVCPGNNESAGKKKNGRARKGNAHLRATLVQAAMAAAHTKGSYFKDKYFRLKSRRGAKRAALAIAHKVLVAAYHILATGRTYKELGDLYLDQLTERRVTSNLVRRLERLGYDVSIERSSSLESGVNKQTPPDEVSCTPVVAEQPSRKDAPADDIDAELVMAQGEFVPPQVRVEQSPLQGAPPVVCVEQQLFDGDVDPTPPSVSTENPSTLETQKEKAPPSSSNQDDSARQKPARAIRTRKKAARQRSEPSRRPTKKKPKVRKAASSGLKGKSAAVQKSAPSNQTKKKKSSRRS